MVQFGMFFYEFIVDKGRLEDIHRTHERHTIAGRDMECLLWVFWREIAIL